MDKVPRKRYHGKLECWEVDLVDRLPLPRQLDQLALTAAMSTPPVAGEGSSSVKLNPLVSRPILAIMPLGGAHHSSAESDEDNKDGINSDVWRIQAKRKAILAMGETVIGVPNFVKQVQTKHSFSRLLNSISSTLAAIILIPDDDTQWSEGVSGASKHPVVPVPVDSFVPIISSPSKGPSDPRQASISPGRGTGEGSSGPSPFVPTWSLHNESCLSVHANAMEFARYAFPPAAVADMEAMVSPSLSHNITYVAAQAMFYLIAGTRHIQLLGEMEATHAWCGSCVIELERHVSELGDDLQRSEQKYQLLVSEKAIVEKVRSTLEAKVDSLTQVNEGLMIQVESLERDAIEHDQMVTALQASADVAQHDLDWLLQVGLV